jgi:hypothetical protein
MSDLARMTSPANPAPARFERPEWSVGAAAVAARKNTQAARGGPSAELKRREALGGSGI